MKYDEMNKPIVCYQTQNKCYKGTREMKPLGVLWHSTAANNPNIARYVQPSDNAKDREEMLKIIGVNKYKNDWNHTDRLAGMNAFIGKLADGTVATVQTMPWNYRPWGCGSGSKGSCNDTHVQFEICESNLSDEKYTWEVYNEAVQFTAYICKMYGIDPHGTIDYKGIKVPTILCHQDSAKLGLGNNHSDVLHWFPKTIGKTMEDVRNDVAAVLGSSSNTPVATPTTDSIVAKKGDKESKVKEIQQALLNKNYDLGKWGADGDFGSATEAAVKKFQIANNLAVTGTVDRATYDLLFAAPTLYTITMKDVTKEEIAKIQAVLPVKTIYVYIKS